ERSEFVRPNRALVAAETSCEEVLRCCEVHTVDSYYDVEIALGEAASNGCRTHVQNFSRGWQDRDEFSRHHGEQGFRRLSGGVGVCGDAERFVICHGRRSPLAVTPGNGKGIATLRFNRTGPTLPSVRLAPRGEVDLGLLLRGRIEPKDRTAFLHLLG